MGKVGCAGSCNRNTIMIKYSTPQTLTTVDGSKVASLEPLNKCCKTAVKEKNASSESVLTCLCGNKLGVT